MKIHVNGETRAAAQRRLEAAGLQGQALDLVLQAGGAQRHAARVQAAWTAAWIWAEARHYASFPQQEVAAVAILFAELIGVGGGPFGRGYSTQRHPAFRGLGKGRRQASDGPAWDAALLGALQGAGQHLPRPWGAAHQAVVQLRPRQDADGEWHVEATAGWLYWTVDRLGFGQEAEPCVVDVTNDVGQGWLSSLALAALGVRQADVLRLVGQLPACFEENPSGWGALYNRLMEPVPEPPPAPAPAPEPEPAPGVAPELSPKAWLEAAAREQPGLLVTFADGLSVGVCREGATEWLYARGWGGAELDRGVPLYQLAPHFDILEVRKVCRAALRRARTPQPAALVVE